MAGKRLLRYVGRFTQGEYTLPAPDSRTVQVDEVIEVDSLLARDLLNAPGEDGDEYADFIPEPRGG